MRIVLASSSPRRREILNLIGFKNFDVISAEVEEIKIYTLADVKKNALLKALDVEKKLSKGENFLIIAADTAVFLENKFLGKPASREEAKGMLRALSGRWHTVYTAVAVVLREGKHRRLRAKLFSSRVKFKKLSPAEIDWYLKTGEPMDKAGAYGIQGYGAIFIEKISGDFFTVMGLPASGLYKMLVKLLGTERVLKLLSTPLGSLKS
jgi:septum formation protein